MSHRPCDATASDDQKRKRPRRSPPWCIGVIIGEAVWGLALFGAHAFDAYEHWFPRWFLQLDLADTLGSMCMVIAAPVAVGGWLLIWGDNGPPYQWLESTAFNIGFGLCLYALLGAIVSHLISRRIGRGRVGGIPSRRASAGSACGARSGRT